MKILRRLLNNTNFLIGSSLTLLYYSRYLKYEIKKVAETEMVNNAFHYVAVRAARGEYISFKGDNMAERVETYFNGLDQAVNDYKFFNQVKHHDDIKIVRPRKPVVNLIKQSRSEQ